MLLSPANEMFCNFSREYLPLVLGKDAIGDLAETTSSYSPLQQPSILNEFSTVAYRYWNVKLVLFFILVKVWAFYNCRQVQWKWRMAPQRTFQ